MARPKRPATEQILVWCGVVTQLVKTRNNRLLGKAGLPYPQFVMLRHFCHDPERAWTVSQLAAAFESPQPGISKTVRKLVDRGLLREQPDRKDARRKWLRVSPRGIRVRDAAVARLQPDQRGLFAGWSRKDIETLHRLLSRLKTHLDDHRDDLIWPDSEPR